MANHIAGSDSNHLDLPFSPFVDNMKPEDVGLSRDLQFKTRKGVEGPPRVINTTIYKCDNFSVRLVICTL